MSLVWLIRINVHGDKKHVSLAKKRNIRIAYTSVLQAQL